MISIHPAGSRWEKGESPAQHFSYTTMVERSLSINAEKFTFLLPVTKSSQIFVQHWQQQFMPMNPEEGLYHCMEKTELGEMLWTSHSGSN